jgi:predicted extracellular nuclease
MAKTSLRVMFINLENLFSPGVNFYGSHYSQEQYNDKVSWIASRIAEADAHVVALSELGENSESCINDVMRITNEQSDASSNPFQHEFRAVPGGTSTRIRTAVMSRFDLSDTDSIVTYPEGFSVDLHVPRTSHDNEENWVTVPSSRFSRPVAKVRVNTGKGSSFNLFVVHLKSKRPIKVERDGYNEAIGIARSAVQRNVEAAALRYYLDTFLPEQYDDDKTVPTFLVGDFNDTPTSVPVENIRGPFDKVPGPASKWSAADKRRLVSCARLHLKKSAYEDKLFSYVHNESFSLIDQAFVSEHLVSKFKRFEVYNDHVFRHQDMSVKTDEEQQWKSMVSDHGIIVMEFTRMLKGL